MNSSDSCALSTMIPFSRNLPICKSKLTVCNSDKFVGLGVPNWIGKTEPNSILKSETAVSYRMLLSEVICRQLYIRVLVLPAKKAGVSDESHFKVSVS